MKKPFIVIVFCYLLFLISCSVSPEEIRYGSDQCAYCSMNIVDKTHASQVVTSKGKQYKYDAVECLIHHIHDEELANTELAFILVTDYNNPGTMTPAKEAHFLISKNIPSPMGANLSAFKNIEAAQATQQENGGEIYNWETINEKMRLKK
ncbi:MAG: nitrous oxide reductase accessory protein NosL [Chitinophagales bacterium]